MDREGLLGEAEPSKIKYSREVWCATLVCCLIFLAVFSFVDYELYELYEDDSDGSQAAP
jgi:hypothetical protein